MIWKDLSKERPKVGELIWIWDMKKQSKFLIKYFGSEEDWIEKKENSNFPIWAYLNE